MGVLGEFHEAIGRLVKQFDATVGFLAGDGVELFFNDPIEIDDPALRAVRLACALRERWRSCFRSWLKRGYELDFGVGIAFGYATLGEIGFEGRSDYAAVGAVTILASRLVRRGLGRADPDQPAHARRGRGATSRPRRSGDFTLKGFARPVPAYNVLRLRP